MRVAICLLLAWACASGQSFEVASVKTAPDGPIRCSGGPGTSDPGWWRCPSVPLGLLISTAYGFQAYQFRPNDPCCQERVEIAAKIPPGTTREQFLKMQQRLLAERFHLKLHLEPKEMPVYELSVDEKGSKLKASGPDSPPAQEDPWAEPVPYTRGKDGYPVFAEGRGGVAGWNGHYRWVGYRIPMAEMLKTLSFYLGRPVLDATGLSGTYDLDLRWWIDMAWALERAGYKDEAASLPDAGSPGPPLTRAVQDQLGLKLTSKKGRGEVVVIDHLEKTPAEN